MEGRPTFYIDAPPWYAGDGGRAWHVRIGGEGKPENAGVAAIVVEAPWAHPVWHSYLLSLIHLRDLPGMGPPLIYRPGATHELTLWALNPDQPVDLCGILHCLKPVNFSAQLVCDSDGAAIEQVEAAARDICDGNLNPDTDFIRTWMHRFGDHMIKDKERAGETRVIINAGEPDQAEIIIPARPGPQDVP